MKLQYTFDSFDTISSIVEGVVMMRNEWIANRLNGYENKLDLIHAKLNFINAINCNEISPKVIVNGYLIANGVIAGAVFCGEFNNKTEAIAAYEQFKGEHSSTEYIPGAIFTSELEITYMSEKGFRVNIKEETRLKSELEDLWEEYQKFKNTIPADFWE